jgi:lycopene cyclase domain-containing protein
MLFTANHVWSFNSSYILGLTIYNLPLEEILFFVCIPFACIFTYHCFTLYLKWEWNAVLEKYFVPSFSLVLLLIGIMNLQKDYTSVTFISCALFLLALKYYFNAHWLQQFLIVYLFLLLPFFIVNGILTGTGIEHPVVMYNNAENLGIRLLTIPVEDIFYGMEMLLLNAFFYERFKSSQ